MARITRPACPLLVILLIGSSFFGSEALADESAARPAPAPELQILDRWRGTWDVEARRRVPQPATVTYIDTYQWVLDRRFIRGNSGPRSDGTTGMSMATYDPQMRAYRFWSFESTGFAFELIPAHWNQDTRTMEWDGGLFSPVAITGRVQFIDDDTIHWSTLLRDWKGTVILDMEGTSIRRR